MIFIRILLAGKLWKCIRLAKGMQSREARREEVVEICNDLAAISTTSWSSDTISFKAIISACHISANCFQPPFKGLQFGINEYNYL